MELELLQEDKLQTNEEA